jgi:hypothetical protein
LLANSRMDLMKGPVTLRMLADKDTEKGGFIAEQSPFCSLQTHSAVLPVPIISAT